MNSMLAGRQADICYMLIILVVEGFLAIALLFIERSMSHYNVVLNHLMISPIPYLL